MSKTRKVEIVALAALAVFLWARSISREGSVWAVLSFAIAGTLSGISLAWIAWSFASAEFHRKTAIASLFVGFFIFTPLIANLLTGNDTPLDSSAVVLATTAACVAAMGGAIWGVMHLARGAFADWRDERKTPQALSLREAHR